MKKTIILLLLSLSFIFISEAQTQKIISKRNGYLAGLKDVRIDTLNNGDMLQYNYSLGKWIAIVPNFGSGSSASYVFDGGLLVSNDTVSVGGSINKPILFNQGQYPFIVNNGALTGKGTGFLSDIDDALKTSGFVGFSNDIMTFSNVSVDTVNAVGASETGIANNSTGEFISSIMSNVGDSLFYTLKVNNNLKLIATHSGFEINSSGYSGDYLININNTFKIKANGIMVISLPSFNDDAAAISGGLQSGDTYQLSATNTYSLPAGLHKTVQ